MWANGSARNGGRSRSRDREQESDILMLDQNYINLLIYLLSYGVKLLSFYLDIETD